MTTQDARPDTRESRPNPFMLADDLRHLANVHDELERLTNHKPPATQTERVDKSDGTEHPAPGHWTAIAIRTDIHLNAREWAAMLNQDRGLKPATGTTRGYLELVATYPGYFTNHENTYLGGFIAEAVTTLINRAAAALDPDHDTHKTPIGPCFEAQCNGKLTITWTTTEGDDNERAWRLGQSRPTARCTKDHTHRIDAMLYAAGRHG